MTLTQSLADSNESSCTLLFPLLLLTLLWIVLALNKFSSDINGMLANLWLCRMGGGFWRRGGETPAVVKWEERIIEIREGSWSYIAGSVGIAPGKN